MILKNYLIATLMLGWTYCSYAQLSYGWEKEINYQNFTYQKNKKQQQPGAAKSKHLANAGQRPDHLNNALLKYFPPIFNQAQGSCDAASYIGYQWTYERNNYYDLDGSLDENRFTSHFNYLLAHNNQGTSKAELLRNVGNPSVADYGGQTYSRFFGNQICTDTDYGWMQGYDKWYRAMHNRDWTTTTVEQSVMTEEGREILKNWLWNHNGDFDFNAGGVAWFGMAATDIKIGKIPRTATNLVLGVSDKSYVAEWGPSYNHAQTIVGYDDRIEFDLDSNGIYGEKDKDEVGAWIIANSWGSGWQNNGFVYCPYARSVQTISYTNPWSAVRHFIRKDYEPIRTLKAKIAFSKRSLLLLSVCATQDTASNASQDSIALDHFKYAGDGSKNFANPPETPMLGKWIDGIHSEPMEFGYDLTAITQKFDRRKPIKYFFNIYTRPNISDDLCGTGRLYSASIIDYELDGSGIEFPLKVENVTLGGSGKLYRISVIVPGEQINPPLNLTTNDDALVWEKPTTTSLPITKYYVYCDNHVIDSVSNQTFTYTPAIKTDKAYGIAAVYNYRNKTILSDKSNQVCYPIEQNYTDNHVLKMDNTFAAAEGVAFSASQGGTIEYWIKPSKFSDFGNQIGNNTYFYTSTSNYRAVFGGWSSSDKSGGTSNALAANTWSHVAVVIDGPLLRSYVNGVQVKNYKTSSNNGVNAFDNFNIGTMICNGLINGQVDEIRLWNRALTLSEINNNRLSEISDPAAQPDLVLYYKGDTFVEDGVTKIRDYARGHHAVIAEPDNVEEIVDNSFLIGTTNLTLSINKPTEDIYQQTPIKFTATIPASAKSVRWIVDDDESTVQTQTSPYITFPEEGSHVLTLTIINANNREKRTRKTLTIKPLSAPVADFEITKDNLPASESFSFVNRSNAINSTYTWSMPGADVEEVHATNAAARFLQVGSYPVTLKVTNAAGTSTITKYVTAIASAPSVDLDVYPSTLLLGDKVFFEEKCIYDPEEWQWEINHINGKHNYVIHAQNSAFKPLAPGYYNVTLKASNAQGTTSKTINKAFAVSNADPGNALSMSGSGERFAAKSPISSDTHTFTIDTWLYPASIIGALSMSTDDGAFKTWSNSDGSVSLSINDRVATSDPNYIILDEWHHYAITFSAGNVKFYRDAELFSSPSKRLSLKCPAWSGSLTVSSDTLRFKGIIDEFRVWSKALTPSQIRSFCNQPIPTDQIEDAKANNGLLLYYQFNQNSGNMADATGNEYTGTRLGFGPDGDAWTSALGVFTLDFDGDEPSDVSADYLTNYKAPFLDNGTSVSTTNASNLLGLLTDSEQSTWVIENPVVTEKATTGAHVCVTLDSDINFRTGYYGFVDTLKNHRLYQTVKLPAGYYTLSVIPGSNGPWVADSSFICVVKGDEFVDLSNYQAKADAYTTLDKKSINFTVGTEEDITIGLIVNLAGWSAIDINEFKLMRTPIIEVEPDEQTSVYDAVASGDMQQYTPMYHSIRVINDKLKPMRVYTLDGRLVFNEMVEGVHIIPFMPGIYVVDGQTIKVD